MYTVKNDFYNLILIIKIMKTKWKRQCNNEHLLKNKIYWEHIHRNKENVNLVTEKVPCHLVE